ncbi:hypothetical protein GCM10025768_01370 [Microbacterium pseudoresistens]|uniref:Uncharacterized protein n=1 Tax=Microbacterium pseudoresistens TaxID=640634 RepID=A0A7Y9EU17_9MICO|nr:hypothetical protein [Microbacterium pseudoresistens]NYD53972.1 hypothetical protein [Microbacterium pseudoresistens]
MRVLRTSVGTLVLVIALTGCSAPAPAPSPSPDAVEIASDVLAEYTATWTAVSGDAGEAPERFSEIATGEALDELLVASGPGATCGSRGRASS